MYQAHLAPFLRQYEPTIDSYTSEYKLKLYQYLQAQFRVLWKHISALIAQHTGINLNNVDPQASPRTEAVQGLAGSERAPNDAGQVGSATDLGLSHGARVALGLWKTWGPTVVSALRPIQDGQQSTSSLAAPPAQADRATDSAPSSTSGYAGSSSVLARRRQLQAELAALALHATSGSPELPTIPTPSTSSASDLDRMSPAMSGTGLHQSQYLNEADARTIRDASGKYEEIGKDELESGEEGDEHPEIPATSPPSAGWWPAWGRKPSGYERLKRE